jgi:hypothetical protein
VADDSTIARTTANVEAPQSPAAEVGDESGPGVGIGVGGRSEPNLRMSDETGNHQRRRSTETDDLEA